MASEIARLEEELDSDEISLKIYEVRETNSEQQKRSELEVYKKYIEGMLNCLNLKNNRLGRSLLRG
jgi:hypothetical protein